MEFAKRELEKYGWKDGEGLGKSKTGISKAIRVKLKFDKGGLGHEFDDVNNTWWKRVYDDAARNIVTKKDSEKGVVLEAVDESLEIISTRKKARTSKNSQPIADSKYKNFVKTSETHHTIESNSKKDSDCEVQNERTDFVSDVTDEDLFKICGKRTAHKGARHGLNMSAKLARLERQENLDKNLSFLEKSGTQSEPSPYKKKKKRKKHS